MDTAKIRVSYAPESCLPHLTYQVNEIAREDELYLVRLVAGAEAMK